ncbi:hypothetical protein RJ492_000522 [Pluralibacter gergoviae]|uniref:Ead/Ea22-like family protein n=1 Tax=Pluralibacter gergoviae TaxID=61647 RepID=A0AAI9GKC6_PLUGE|nr:hypothetical protein [Pluralibacter gergoviae]EKV0913249.1 hypothetical protein [Pluralibacter gergoviae]EKV9907922.1 hypothetical protein [Pluralibacter gergoviae]EKW6617747.1 hypothetical protein [Pluralibacter gergoviae]EKW7272484.1 hypothetical protein [Pluralibacter gergoviae]EKW9974076.1 hypothetical protein [Pluralibacter gergoviae]
MKPTYEELEKTVAALRRRVIENDHNWAVMIDGYERKCAELKQQVAALAADNAQMLRLLTDISENHVEYYSEGEDGMFAGIPLDYVSEINMYVSRDVNAENPFTVTDAAIAEIRASAITAALCSSSEYLDTDCVMYRLGISYELAGMRTAGAIELHDSLISAAKQLRAEASK